MAKNPNEQSTLLHSLPGHNVVVAQSVNQLNLRNCCA